MATTHPSKTKKAERNNDQLFPLFARTFQTGTAAEFATTAHKFSNWLGVDKAYYPKARPIIVELLETAHDTVRRHSGYPDLPFHISRMNDGVRPYADAFVRLVRTVVPFYFFFPEPPLRARLHDIFQTICDDVAQFLSQQPLFHRGSMTPSVITTRTTPLSSPLLSPVVSQAPVAPSSAQGLLVQETSAYPLSAQLSNLAAPSSTGNPLVATIPSRPDSPLASSPTMVAPIPPQTDEAQASVMSPTPATISPTTATSQSTRPKAKRKKLAFDDFIEADLNWYKDKHSAQTQESLPPTPHVASAEATPSIDASSAPVAPLKEPLPKKEIPQSAEAVSVIGPSSATLDAKTSRSTSASLLDDEPNKSRSPSVPPRFLVKLPRKRKAPDDEDVSQEARVESTSRSPPRSPTLLTPSIKRRRTPSMPPPVVADDKEETDAHSHIPASVSDPSATSTALPSPLATKKEKKKKRKGPPGLKVLPLHPLTEEQLQERLEAQSTAIEPSIARPVVEEENIKEESNKEEERAESEPKSRSWTPPPESLSSHKPNALPALVNGVLHAVETEHPATPGPNDVAAEHEDTARSNTPVPAHAPLDAVPNDTAVLAASPDTMEVDAALEPSCRSVSEESAAPDVADIEQEAGGSATHVVPMGDPEQAGSIPPGDDVPMQSASHAVPSDKKLTHLEPSRIVDAVLRADEPGYANIEAIGIANAKVASTAPSLIPDRLPLATVPVPLQEEQMDPRTSPFESTAPRLLSLERGCPSYTSPQEPVELNFTLSDEEVQHIAQWRDQKSSISDLSTSMCVSLVSYPLEQCTKAFESDRDPEQEEVDVVAFGCPRSWPQDGSVYVVLDVSGDHGTPRTINVAPPFGFNTIHQPVDIGKHGVHPGENTLHLFQFRDHSDRIFAVVLHHPTSKQLAEVQAARDRDRALEDWIDGLGRFDLPAPRLFTTPPGNVVSDR